MPIVLLIIVAALLWWPRYDLEVALKPGPSEYRIVERDFYLLDSCREAVRRWQAYDWICLEKTTWGQIFNSYSPYNKKVR